MSNINELGPKLRFPEYKSPLLKVGYAELGEIKIGLTHKPDYISEGVPFLSSKNISNGYIDFKNIQYISREKFESMPESTKPQIGDILFTRVGSNLGNPIILEQDIEFGIFVSLGIFRVNERAYNYYMKYWMESEYFWKQLNQKVAGGAKDNLNSTWLREFELFLPSIEEQQKIAYCLLSLDEVIIAEGKKLDILKDHKKGLLQNILPQEGEIVPKFRFKEFENGGEWEETTLTQIACYENGKAHEQDITDDGKFIVVNSKFISQDGEVKKFTNTAFCPANKGDVLMVLSDIPNGRAIAKCFLVEEDNRYTVNQRICRLIPRNLNSKILYYLLNRNPYFLAFDDGVKQTNLRKEDVLNCPLLIPSDPKEQQKIADTLSSLDELINTQNEKIESLKLHKKGLLQGLFPTINNEV